MSRATRRSRAADPHRPFARPRHNSIIPAYAPADAALWPPARLGRAGDLTRRSRRPRDFFERSSAAAPASRRLYHRPSRSGRPRSRPRRARPPSRQRNLDRRRVEHSRQARPAMILDLCTDPSALAAPTKAAGDRDRGRWPLPAALSYARRNGERWPFAPRRVPLATGQRDHTASTFDGATALCPTVAESGRSPG